MGRLRNKTAVYTRKHSRKNPVLISQSVAKSVEMFVHFISSVFLRVAVILYYMVRQQYDTELLFISLLRQILPHSKKNSPTHSVENLQ